MNQLKSIRACKRCGNPAISFDGYCDMHCHFRSIKDYCARPMPSNKHKNQELFGVEIELKNFSNRRLSNLAKYVCYDGSVCSGAEIKILGNFNSAIRQTLDIIKRANYAGCFVDKDCGFHIHVSRNQSIMFERVMNIQDKIREIFPSRLNNNYCKRVNFEYDLYHHYSWVNFSDKVPTIEFRIFPSTLNKRVATSYIRISKKVYDYFIGNIDESDIKNCIKKFGTFIRGQNV